MKKYLFTAAGILLTVSMLLAGCSQEVKKEALTTVKIGYVDSGKSFPTELLAIAVEKGYIDEEFKKLGLKPEFIPFVGAGPAINEGLGSKNLDIGVYGDTPAILAKGAGMETTLLGTGNTGQDAAILVPVDSPITSVQDLKGKKVATMKGAYMHRTLVEALKANNLSVKDIEFFHMTAPEAETALISQKVEAIVSPNTSVAKLVVNKQAKVVINCKDHPEWKGQNFLIARTEFAKNNPNAVVAFLKGLIRAKQYVTENPEDAKLIWTKAGYTKEQIDYMYPENKFYFELVLSDKTIQNIKYTKDFLLENNILKGNFDVDKWIDKNYYEKALGNK
ncbi:MAG TPA: aliphatic sulfonate ABC transporter substrate-binding protein [Methylomusa anaerophila]|uniref:Putative aliphatic sulfonates-binding protein n=1 Tax=Methylomusa anaerophila TaxID=1930071 RepID=A0A348AG23_9FIRM|nr:aliphatic sulfonate ABC transporter substrate-binding protein [Methylomusa anaerophila]BBB90021.1 putative aliphatic sulfonates-binding protein precursor [Methylomusa anaerophila]HML88250.1 aliphatic sulfonate ABC transporter substrate-binding protein [Methylomusa anaerophila]